MKHPKLAALSMRIINYTIDIRWFELPKLEILELQGRQIESLSQLGKFPMLKKLSISQSFHKGFTDDEIQVLKSLNLISLSITNFEIQNWEFLDFLPDLERLKI